MRMPGMRSPRKRQPKTTLMRKLGASLQPTVASARETETEREMGEGEGDGRGRERERGVNLW
jgi:hypothetical protein